LKNARQTEASSLLDRIVSLYPDWGYGWRRRLVFKPPAAEAGVGGAVASLLRPARRQHGPGAGDDLLCSLAAELAMPRFL